MKQVVVFGTHAKGMEAYDQVEEDVNAWLLEHPNAQIIASHTNMVADEESTEFSLTLIVELPEQE